MSDLKELEELLVNAEVEKALELISKIDDKKAAAEFLNDFAASLMAQIGDYPNAYLLLKKALELNPEIPEAYYNLGLLLSEPEVLRVNSKNLDDAIANYKKAITLNPKLARAYYNLGLIYAYTGKKKEAMENYNSAVKNDPKNRERYDNILYILKKKGL